MAKHLQASGRQKNWAAGDVVVAVPGMELRTKGRKWLRKLPEPRKRIMVKAGEKSLEHLNSRKSLLTNCMKAWREPRDSREKMEVGLRSELLAVPASKVLLSRSNDSDL
jgi:hypothetical protein